MSKTVYPIKLVGRPKAYSKRLNYQILEMFIPFGWISRILSQSFHYLLTVYIEFFSKSSQEHALMLNGVSHSAFAAPLTVSIARAESAEQYVKFFVSKTAVIQNTNPLLYPILAINSIDTNIYPAHELLLKEISSLSNFAAIAISSTAVSLSETNSKSIFLFCSTDEDAEKLIAKSPIKLKFGHQTIEISRYQNSNLFNPNYAKIAKLYPNLSIESPSPVKKLTTYNYLNDPWFHQFVSVFGPTILASLPEIDNEKDANQLLMNIYHQLPDTLKPRPT